MRNLSSMFLKTILAAPALTMALSLGSEALAYGYGGGYPSGAYGNPYGSSFVDPYNGVYSGSLGNPGYGMPSMQFGGSSMEFPSAAFQPGGFGGYGMPRGFGPNSAYGRPDFGASRFNSSPSKPDFRPQQPKLSEPELVLRDGIAKLQSYIKQQASGGDKAQAMAFVEREIAPYFDFNYMAQWAAGSNWRYLNSSQKGELSQKIAQMFLKSLSRNLGGYGDPKVDIRPARQASNEVKIPVVVTPRNTRGVQVTLMFRFYRSADGWKIFDVTANNTSAVMYYRRHFGKQLRDYRYGY